LMLINDILDLSKIESGTVVVDAGELRLSDLHGYVERTFRHVAESKGVDFTIELSPDLPRAIFTDSKRLQQVIKNLLSNSFKFTHQGRVSLSVETARDGWSPENEDLDRAPTVLAFSVSDTGIGISQDKQQIIFEAFQQADGSTSRKYGGTGLGLAISREISRLLGGEIRLYSSPGKGSTFTLYLPQTYVPQKSARKPVGAGENGHIAAAPRPEFPPASPEIESPKLVNEVGDDRDTSQPGDPLLLIVENDLAFAKVLLDAAREKGFKGLVTSLGAAALAMTRDYMPVAMTLDICLPDIDGWRVLERLKSDLATRHIPVCVVSTEEDHDRAMGLGALSVFSKPFKTKESLEQLLDTIREFVERPVKDLLLVGLAPEKRERILDSMGSEDIRVTSIAGGRDALEVLGQRRIDCMVIDGDLGDISADGLVEGIQRGPGSVALPVILYSDGRPAEGAMPRRHGPLVTVRHADSPEQLLDQTAFFLHTRVRTLPEAKRQMLEGLYQTDRVLAGKKVLIVDDDIRNIFALTSILEWRNMKIVSAETGRDAISVLQTEPDVDIVLMDIMMPEMDGIDTMRAIRKIPRFKSLPIVAVTAKAMKGDREKCIEAGAWDYLSKPVNTEQLLSVLRAWLHR
ncbi:MAG TPA: response regulator, partial [Isosphaeraceae bacterium]